MKLIISTIIFFISFSSHAERIGQWLNKVDASLVKCLKQATAEADKRSCYYNLYEAMNKTTYNLIGAVRTRLTKEASEWDSQFNIPKEQKTQLEAAQAGWVKYAEAQCNLEAAGELGGTNHTTTVGECLFRMTKRRLIELAKFFDY